MTDRRRALVGITTTLGLLLSLSACFWPPSDPPGECDPEDDGEIVVVTLDSEQQATVTSCLHGTDDQDSYSFTAPATGTVQIACISAADAIEWRGETPDAVGSFGVCQPGSGDIDAVELETGEVVSLTILPAGMAVGDDAYTLTFSFAAS